MSKLVRKDDVLLLVEKARAIGLRSLLGKVLGTDRTRVHNSWKHVDSERSNWWDLDAVTRRWNRLITGSADVTYQQYVAKKYFSGKRNLRAISIGCGTGRKEIDWMETKKFQSLIGFDVSVPRIKLAKEFAGKSKWKDRLRFEVGNVFDLKLDRASYDVVIFDNSLHHCSPLARVIDQVDDWLGKRGILIVNEYVGPSRFQWTDDQVSVTDSLLHILPTELKQRKDGSCKDRMLRPGTLAMRLNDPSEAAESHLILSSLEQRFEVLELKPYGGTILANLLKDIAQNFLNDDRETREWLQFLFDVEDRLMALKKIRSDYVFGIFKSRFAGN